MLTSLTRENIKFSDTQLSPPNRKILKIEYEESDASRHAKVAEQSDTFHRAPIQDRVETDATKIFQWKQFVKAMEKKSSRVETNATKILKWKQFVKAMEKKSSHKEERFRSGTWVSKFDSCESSCESTSYESSCEETTLQSSGYGLGLQTCCMWVSTCLINPAAIELRQRDYKRMRLQLHYSNGVQEQKGFTTTFIYFYTFQQ